MGDILKQPKKLIEQQKHNNKACFLGNKQPCFLDPHRIHFSCQSKTRCDFLWFAFILKVRALLLKVYLTGIIKL